MNIFHVQLLFIETANENWRKSFLHKITPIVDPKYSLYFEIIIDWILFMGSVRPPIKKGAEKYL